MQKHKVIVYGTPTCPYCIDVKRWLKANKIEFTDKNVQEDREAAKEMIAKTHQTGVPVLDIDGYIIIGFAEEQIKEALEI